MRREAGGSPGKTRECTLTLSAAEFHLSVAWRGRQEGLDGEERIGGREEGDCAFQPDPMGSAQKWGEELLVGT